MKKNPIKKILNPIIKVFDKIIIVPVTKVIVTISKKFESSGRGMEKFLSKSNNLLFISLALAVGIFIVIDQKIIYYSESSAEVLSNQPVKAIYNEEAYVIEGLPESVDITLIGNKANLYIAKQSGTNEVTLDLTDLKAGTHKVEVTGIRKDEPLNHIENKEIWDLYDHDGKLTGETFERRFGNFRNIPDGRYHLVVDLLVIHSDGTYLLTRRSEEKDWYPGYWEASAGGAALKGEEPLDAANRELTEETGLIPDSLELVDVSFKDSTHAMYYSYIARVSGDKDGITLQEGETTDYKWVDAAGFISYVDSDGAMKSHNQRYEKYISTLR